MTYPRRHDEALDATLGALRAWLASAGQVSPRNLIRLIEHAAFLERQRPRAGKRPQLLHHVSLRNALTRVSEEQVRESISSGYPWLRGVKERLQEGTDRREVPWDRGELERLGLKRRGGVARK